MKNMFKDMVNILMQSEFDKSIGYDKYDRESSATTRNRYNSKQVNTSLGKIFLEIERDSLNQQLFLNILEISLILKIKLSLCMDME